MSNRVLFLLIFWFSQAALALAQTNIAPGVLTIKLENKSAYAPVFSPFCDDIVWLRDDAFRLSAQQFLAADSSMTCVPEKARRTYFGTDPIYHRYMRWETDPYNNQYYWSFEYQRDTFILWRYDLEAAKLDSFISLPKGRISVDHAIGKAGIWVASERGLALHDRHTGSIIKRMGRPAESNIILSLRPWGEDILVTDRWLYRWKENRYEDFFPLPEDLKGCKSPDRVKFYGEACITSTVGGEDNGEYLIAAGHKPIRLPFEQHWSIRRYDLAVNPQNAWFSFPDKVLAFDYTTGDSIVYQGSTGEPLIGDQAGRFLGFQSEKGLSFFDKNSCQFRVLGKAYGYETPRNFISGQRYIYLTYENHWEIIEFSKLDTAFKRSLILEGFEAFSQEHEALRTNQSKDFYLQYAAYLGLMRKYQKQENPKIEAEWPRISNQLRELLYQAPDSILERVGKDYFSGRFSPNLSCGIVASLFEYWCRKTDLKQALYLLEIAGNEACIEEQSGYGAYFIQLLRTTKHRLDSIALLKIPPDERLYVYGAVWWDYSTSQIGFGYRWSVQEGIKKPMAYFRELIQKYPASPWADNAVYDSLYYVDYQSQSTDDYMPVGNDNKAYRDFTQFLQDYPTSDRKPDVLVRLANIVQRGVYTENFSTIEKEAADDYLYTVATEYPDFAKNSKAYQESLARQNRYQWSNRWNITLAFNQEKYRLADSIFVTVQLQNRSGSPKILEGDFLQDWHKGLKLQLSKVLEAGCEGLWGDFHLLPFETRDSIRAVSVQPRAFYAETFMLERKSYTRRFYPGSFELESGASYDYHLEFRHDQFSWLWVEAKNRGRIRVE